MAATLDHYPVNGDPIVRGDPLTIPVTIDEADVSAWTWRSYIRTGPDAPATIAEFDVEPDPDDTSRVLLVLSAEETRLLRSGMGFDLEQQTPTQRTWLVVKALRVQHDYTWDDDEDG